MYYPEENRSVQEFLETYFSQDVLMTCYINSVRPPTVSSDILQPVTQCHAYSLSLSPTYIQHTYSDTYTHPVTYTHKSTTILYCSNSSGTLRNNSNSSSDNGHMQLLRRVAVVVVVNILRYLIGMHTLKHSPIGVTTSTNAYI